MKYQFDKNSELSPGDKVCAFVKAHSIACRIVDRSGEIVPEICEAKFSQSWFRLRPSEVIKLKEHFLFGEMFRKYFN